jgi:hypothetical protein
MTFEWDPEKRRRNIEKHRIDFLDARKIFGQTHLVKRSDREGEKRFLAVGRVEGRLIAVAYTERGDNIRIVSARRARDNERRDYRNLYE